MSHWLERHWRSVLLAFMLLAGGGVLAMFQLPVGLFPRIDFPRVVVSVDAGDRPADRMVVEVTRPLEQALRGVPEVRAVRSTSSRGSAEVSLSFDWSTDMVAALLQTEAAVSRALPSLPAGVSFTARRMDPTVFPVLGLSLTSQHRSIVELSDLATYKLGPALSSVSGVARVEILGGRQSEYHVMLDPAQLHALNLTTADVARALSTNNVVVGVGRIEDRFRLFLVLADTRLHDASDIGKAVVKTGPDGIVQLSDVAQVRSASVPAWTRVNANGRDAVLINIMQQRGASTVALAQDIRARLRAFAPQIPSDVSVNAYYDQSELIVAAAGSVRDAIVIGAMLAALVLFAFLRQWRITLVVALTLPGVLAATVLLLDVLHMSFNIMTLGGMAAAVGLVVDDAVVMLEHGMRRLSEMRAVEPGQHHRIMLSSAREMLRPLAGSSFATIVVFVPLAFLSGVAGGFFRALALTMAAALTISFFVALLVVPTFMRRLVRTEDAERIERGGRLLNRILAGYRIVARTVLVRPQLALVAAVLLVATGAVCYLHLGSGFMPRMDEGGFIFDYIAPPGTSLTETDRLMRQVEAIVLATPDVASYSRRTGLQLGGGLTEANEGDMFIKLKPPPRRGIETVMADVRTRVREQVPGMRVETAQLMEDLIGDLISNPQPIEVKVFGAKRSDMETAARQIAAKLEDIAGVVEIFDGIKIAGDAVDVQVDRVKAALEGFDAQTVTQQITALIEGTVTSQIQEGAKMVGVRIWTPLSMRGQIQQLGDFRLRSPAGHLVALDRIASISVAHGQPQIDRDDLRQTVRVTARLEGRDLGSAMKDVRRTIQTMQVPDGIYVEYGGLYAQQQSSFRDLTIVFCAAVLLVALLLTYMYESWTVVISILTTTLVSTSAVFVGLWLTGTELDLSSMMGLTMIVGIVTEVAVFYFAESATAHAMGDDDLIDAGVHRLRPIVMTSSIAILALAPLALDLGAGASMEQPLAIAIISGLVAAVPMVLLVMPALYRLLVGLQRKLLRAGD